jgi:3-hydroxyisobutyrate dehydrogenase-like beta-hydroxyacid dehydrogenase
MGATLAGAFAAAGHDVVGWSRSEERRAAYVAAGGSVAASPREACRTADLIVANVVDYDATRSVLSEAGADALAGRTLVQLASGGPADARALADEVDAYGVDYLDGAILTFPARIGDEPTIIAYSGSRRAFDRHRPTFMALGGRPLFVGEEVGGAAAIDLAWLSVLYGGTVGMLQAAAFCEAEGVDPGHAFDALPSFLVEIAAEGAYYRRLIERGDYSGNQASLDTHVAALHHIVDAAETSGVNGAFPRLCLDVFGRSASEGHGSDEIAAAIEIFRRPG